MGNKQALKIIENRGKIILQYTYGIHKRRVIRKNKAKTENILYSMTFPQEITEYFNVEDRRIFFYEKEGTVYITSRRPTYEHQEIKIQKDNRCSIPKTYFPDVAEYENVVLTLDLSKTDDYKNGLGLLSIKLV